LIRTRAIIISIVIIILLVIMTICAVYSPWAMTKLYNALIISEQPRASDAIIVLSGSSERDIYAADLYNLGFSRIIIMSGCGQTAEVMAARAIKKGVKSEDIIKEQKAVSTYENAVLTREVMLQNGFQSAIVVSSPFHMRRSRLVFERVYKNTGISLTYCAVPPTLSSDTQQAPAVFRRSVIVEYAKLIYYWVRYW
jgi:uncharacterized SAM-binding protein YcdF (DUF218 family)